MSDNYMDLLWQSQSCLLMCKRDSELFHVLAAKGICHSLTSTQCLKDNPSQLVQIEYDAIIILWND